MLCVCVCVWKLDGGEEELSLIGARSPSGTSVLLRV